MPARKIGRRRHVVLSVLQESRLRQLSGRTGLTESEHIRRAIDSYFRLLDHEAARAAQRK